MTTAMYGIARDSEGFSRDYEPDRLLLCSGVVELTPTLAPRRGKPEEAIGEGPRGANWLPLDLRLQSSPKRAEKVAETPSGGKEGMWGRSSFQSLKHVSAPLPKRYVRMYN